MSGRHLSTGAVCAMRSEAESRARQDASIVAAGFALLDLYAQLRRALFPLPRLHG